ncbi:MAG: toxin-activating lysine-acyltransferase [Pseudomonadota bacterium]
MSKKIEAATIVLSLLEHTELHDKITLAQFEERFLDPIANGQVILYYEGGTPSAFLSWALLSSSDGDRYLNERNQVPPSWSSGDELWLIDFIHAYEMRVPGWIFKHLHKVVFADCARVYARWSSSIGETANAKRTWSREAPRPNLRPVRSKVSYADTELEMLDRQHPYRRLKDGRSEYNRTETEFLRRFHPEENARVLVCGVEANQFARRLAAETSCEVVLFDELAGWLTSVAERAAHATPLLQYPDFSIKHGQWDTLPFEDGTFDSIYSFGAIARCQNSVQFIDELLRVAKPGCDLVCHELLAADDGVTDDELKRHGLWSAMTLEKWDAAFGPYTETKAIEGPVDDEHPFRPMRDWFHAPRKSKFPDTADSHASNLETWNVRLTKSAATFVPSRKTTKRSKLTTLVTFSGGIDSTYVLWKLLKETDDEIIALHINITNVEGRVLIEKIRAQQIVNYLSERYRLITYKTTTIDHSGMNWFGYDVMAVGFEVGIVATSHLLEKNKAVDRWTMAACKEEGRWPNRWQHVLDCTAANCYPHTPPEYFSLPIITKAEQMRQMPSELLEMTWYCRQPKLTRNGYAPCNTCMTCRIVNEIKSERV